MSVGGAEIRRSVPADLVAELERGDAGRPEEIARRPGPGWTENGMLAALAEPFPGGLVGHSHKIGLWWVT
jgi:hypothetical protein